MIKSGDVRMSASGGYLPGNSVTRQVEYKSREDMDRGIREMAAQGWRVQSVTELQQRAGCARMFWLGLFAFIFKPKPHYLVSYQVV